ncbi:MAG: hypothetical protein CMB80_33510 [Flammeovirgaceae bacterium]|nr:hypothetical protein [Flammeovirgaceae bacterium]HCX25175.1 hypothetical protein [Cytophagales bacterium]|tara:strand:+ start:5989 stop:6624 length:636 start_codon:yes stop_codon:yes gene_type:complete
MSAIIDIGRLLRFTFSLLLILPNIDGFNNDLEWKLIKEEDNIQVFARIAENSSIKEIRITCSVKTTMERMESFLSDVPKYADWVYKCDTSILLNRVSDKETYYYTTLNFPFPMTDRDLVIHSIHEIDSLGVYRSHSKASEAYYKEQEDYVRIEYFESTWEITPQNNGTLFIDYFAYSDPGGDIPAWLVNLAIDQGPYRTMKQFVEMIERNE